MYWSTRTQNFKKTNVPLRCKIPCHYEYHLQVGNSSSVWSVSILNYFLTTKGRTSASNRVNKFSKVVTDHFIFKAQDLWHWTPPLTFPVWIYLLRVASHRRSSIQRFTKAYIKSPNHSLHCSWRTHCLDHWYSSSANSKMPVHKGTASCKLHVTYMCT